MTVALTSLSFGFRFFFLLHILAIIVAFAPAFVWPLIGRQARKATGAPGAAAATTAPSPGRLVSRVLSPVVHGAALILAGLFGIILVAITDGLKFNQTWVSIAFLLWFLMIALMFIALVPTERRLASADLEGERRVAIEQRLSMFYGMMHLLLVLMVIDMIWHPGVKGI